MPAGPLPAAFRQLSRAKKTPLYYKELNTF